MNPIEKTEVWIDGRLLPERVNQLAARAIAFAMREAGYEVKELDDLNQLVILTGRNDFERDYLQTLRNDI